MVQRKTFINQGNTSSNSLVKEVLRYIRKELSWVNMKTKYVKVHGYSMQMLKSNLYCILNDYTGKEESL